VAEGVAGCSGGGRAARRRGAPPWPPPPSGWRGRPLLVYSCVCACLCAFACVRCLCKLWIVCQRRAALRAFEAATHGGGEFRADVDYGVWRVRRVARDPATLLRDAQSGHSSETIGETALMSRVVAAEPLGARQAVTTSGRLRMVDATAAVSRLVPRVPTEPPEQLRGGAVTLPFGRALGMPLVHLPPVSQAELFGTALTSLLLPWRAAAALRARREVRPALYYVRIRVVTLGRAQRRVYSRTRFRGMPRRRLCRSFCCAAYYYELNKLVNHGFA
jgi:hypothetical protein